ncbi:MAG: hypothetical protein ACI9P5_004070 [Saprospiraceae bacterium]|jgi:hypothetical protein
MTKCTKGVFLNFNLYFNKSQNFYQMEKQARIDSIVRMIETRLDTYIDEQSETTDPIEYEDRLLELGNKVMLEVLKESRGKVLASRNSKK